MTKRRYRIILGILLMAALVAAVLNFYYNIYRKLPSELRIMVDTEESFDFGVPVESVIEDTIGVSAGEETNIPEGALRLNLGTSFTLAGHQKGEYHMELRLFGLIPIKQVTLNVIDKLEVIPGGCAIGLIVETDGVMVLGTGKITGRDGEIYEPAYGTVESGDYIIAINGSNVSEKETMIEMVQANGTRNTSLVIRRDGEIREVNIRPVLTSDGSYKLGIWVRDDTQGIGTLTFITSTGELGALGHGITDVDTGMLIEAKNGETYCAEIVSITKGVPGTPGEMSGLIHKNDDKRLGSIVCNTHQGIFGRLKIDYAEAGRRLSINTGEFMEIALRQEIQTGPATILSDVNGSIEEYNIEIERVDYSNKNHNKGMVICVTDKRLLALTGGIIQGMSGSPIKQNGKLIGAVTHVFIRDSTRGYGTFIENMLDNQVINTR